MDEGRGIYSVAMFHKKQDTPRVPCFFRVGRWGKFRNSSQTALAFFVAICYHRDHKLKAPP